jgi:hypothetical protein
LGLKIKMEKLNKTFLNKLKKLNDRELINEFQSSKKLNNNLFFSSSNYFQKNHNTILFELKKRKLIK